MIRRNEIHGSVIANPQGDSYSVRVDIGGRGRIVTCRRSGRATVARLRFVVGERVAVELDGDGNRGRILRRVDAK